MTAREQTRIVRVGDKKIGGGNPVLVQSMTQTRTHDVRATVAQILELERAGCEIVRVTVPDMESARAISEIKKHIHVPIVADIHFQYLFALEAIKRGADKIRINPGNIGGQIKIKEIVRACKDKKIPIRIGVNMGSLEKDLYEQYGQYGVARVMVESATRNIKILEKEGFEDIVVSLKGSDIPQTIEAYTEFAKRYEYPLHVGITEAGTPWVGGLKSAVGIGAILAQGIGDTIRVSIAGEPMEQVKIGWEILKVLNLRQKGVSVIACPTCGRTQIDLINLAKQVEDVLQIIEAPIKVAVMGCVVNGPGEARFADIGLSGGKKQAAIFKKGKVVRIIEDEANFLQFFLEEVVKVLKEKEYNQDAEKLAAQLADMHKESTHV